MELQRSRVAWLALAASLAAVAAGARSGVEEGGMIRLGGASWGSASSCCGDFDSKRSVTAVLFLFTDDF